MNKTRACFLHVPKSGGSSVISSLKSSLGDGRLFHANDSRYQQGPLEPLLARYPLVAGHFNFTQISDALLSSTFFFTFLRDPVDRVLSLYYYYRSQTGPVSHDPRVALAQTLELEPFVDALTDRPSPWSNWQTFLFSGTAHSERPAEQLLPAALRNLGRMDFVGIHDDVDGGLKRVCELQGWPAHAAAPRVNVTANRPPADRIPSAVRERLAELNACDVQLFARARQIWSASRGASMTRHTIAAAAVPLGDTTSEHGTREVALTSVRIRTEPDRGEGVAHEHDMVFIDVRAHGTISVDNLTVGIRISDDLGLEVYGTNTYLLGTPVSVRAGEDFELTFAFEMLLSRGTYQVTAAIHAGDDHLDKCYHWIDNAAALECRRGEARTFSGLVNLQAQVSGLATTASAL